MKLLILTLCFPILLFGELKTIKVFVLAGQSNMVGHGKVELGRNPNYNKKAKITKEVKGGIGSLRYLATNSSSKGKYGYLLDSNGKWLVRDDVHIYTTTSGKQTGKLSVGFGKGNWFGPELAFGNLMGNLYNEPVLIIKTAWGGHSLGVNFRPPSSGKPSFKKGNSDDYGKSYENMVSTVKNVCDNLGKHFPDLKEYKPVLTGFGWHQGWNDAGSKEMVKEYDKNFCNLVKDFRKEFDVPNLPFAIANTGMIGFNSKSGGGVDLCNIQLELGNPKKHPEFKGLVKSVETRGFKRSTELSPSGFGYHWNHSAESHYLVGEAMGKAMLELLKK
jgi:hypothetical protein